MKKLGDVINRLKTTLLVMDMRHADCIAITRTDIVEMLVLLKAQEPRVMTLEEVSAVNGGDVIWIEDRCLDQMVVGIKFQSPSKNCYYIMLIGATRPQPFSKELYNVNWRCWTSRPTDEQREAVKWQ